MNNFLIDFVDSATDAEISQYLATQNCTLIRVYSNLNKVYLVSANSVPAASALVTSVTDDSVISITPMEVVSLAPATHNTVTINTADEKNWWKVYSGTKVDLASTTYQYQRRSSLDIDIYLVDSGIMISHPEFVGQTIELLHSVVPNDFSDSSGHGTAIASLITGNTCSINSTPVKVVKLFDQSKLTLQSDLLASFDAIVNSVLLDPSRLGIVNLSWSIPRNVYVEQKIQLLINMGIRVVVSAGNTGLPIADVTPAAMKDVITVGSYNQDFSPCAFSDFGGSVIVDTAGLVNYGELDIWAPGSRIWVAAIDGTYQYAAGTSFSAGIVSASIAYNSAGIIAGSTITQYYRDTNFKPSGKSGLLILSDPKYSNSVNLVVAFTNKDYTRNVPIMPDITLCCSVGDTINCGIANVTQMTSYELLTVLPSWMKIIDTKLIMSPVDQPVDRILEKYEVLFNVTPLVGAPYVQTVTLYVKGIDFNLGIYPANDPLIQVITAGTNLCGGPTCISAGCNIGGLACTITDFVAPKGCNCHVTN